MAGRQPRLEVLSRVPVGKKRTPILFVHGGLVAAWCWDEYFLRYFCDLGYPAHALSLRGHGASEGRERLAWASIDDFVADLEQAYSSFATPPVLVGHSMGGFIVQRFLKRNSPAAAVLMASVPPEGLMESTFSLLIKDFMLFQQIHLAMEFNPRYVNPDDLRRMLFSDDLPQLEALRHFARMQPESQRAIYDMSWPALDFERNGRTVPVLVQGAADDVFFSLSVARRIARSYDAELDVVPRVAHAMMLDMRWRTVADRILDWLRGLGL
jgi:pimeloyl-ACP methyl ester carboxylesterase